MPTRPTIAFLVLSGIFYFLANQTGVGWLYIISNGLVGVVLVAMVYGMGLLRGVSVERKITAGEARSEERGNDRNQPQSEDEDTSFVSSPVPLGRGRERGMPSGMEPVTRPPLERGNGRDALVFEDDEVTVELTVRQEGNRPITSLHGTEVCPFAPYDVKRQQIFIPTLLPKRAVTLKYTTTADHRGVHLFPPLAVETRGPFGLWRARQQVATDSKLLVYPVYHVFSHLPLLENALNPQRQRPRAGTGSEVMGIRDYRPGDAPRTVHWRSSARVGQLMVKEFAEEAQPALAVVLDCATPSILTDGKHSPFESAVRIAASLGYYATQRNIPFTLTAVSPTLTPPRAALSWWAILNLLARVQNDGSDPFEQVLARARTAEVVVALVTNPTDSVMGALQSLARSGSRVIAMLITSDDATIERKSTAPNLTFIPVRATHWRDDVSRSSAISSRITPYAGVATTPT